MKKVLITSTLILATIASYAQTVPAGKTYKATLQSKGTTTMTMQGNDMEIPTTVDEAVEVKITGSNNGNVAGIATITSLKLTVSSMGQERTITSDDPAIRSNPEVAKLLKPQDFQLKNGKIVNAQNVNASMQATSTDVASKLVLPVSGNNLKPNYTWKESISDSTGSTADMNFTITKLTADEVEISFVNTIKSNVTKQQNGMDAKINLTGTLQGTRTYDRATGVLKTENTTIDMKGTTEMMGQESPTTLKGTTSMTVN
ncbi:MAG: DUF6263 family protein [Chitinophagaceae bacterium]|jgi:hypothetical protein|nr:DUF6263 family protein [Chitinophagaceae bacterium]